MSNVSWIFLMSKHLIISRVKYISSADTWFTREDPSWLKRFTRHKRTQHAQSMTEGKGDELS